MSTSSPQSRFSRRFYRVAAASFLLSATLGCFLAAWLEGSPLRYDTQNDLDGHSSQADDVLSDTELRTLVPHESESGNFDAHEHPPAQIEHPEPLAETTTELVSFARPTTERAEISFQTAETYLLVGMDRTRGTWGRADTLLVVVFDEESGHAGVISVPRDLYVDTPQLLGDRSPARINAVLRIAAAKGDEDPLSTLESAIEEVLALQIDHTILGDLDVFESVIDGLGGIEVDVPCALRDNFIDHRTDNGRRILDVEAGTVEMDGVTAAMYARSRHGRSDWSRSRRQHAILRGIRAKLEEMSVLEWAPVLSDALSDGVMTSMTRLEIAQLVRRGRRLRESRLHGVVLGSRHVQRFRTDEGRAVLLPDFEAIDEALEGLFEAPAPGVSPRRRECQAADIALNHRQPRSREPQQMAQVMDDTAARSGTNEDEAHSDESNDSVIEAEHDATGEGHDESHTNIE